MNTNGTRRTHRRTRAFATGVAVVLLAACSSGAPARHIPTVMVGDSLLYEARGPIRSALGRARVLIHAVPGTAACDLLPWLREETSKVRARLVVIETMGNVFTGCIRAAGPSLSDAARRKTVRDVVALADVATSAGARVLIVDPLPVGGLSATGDAWLTALTDDMRRAFAGRSDVQFTDRPRRSVAPDGRFVASLPCAASETGCVDGRVAVRDPYFGIHFCPRPYADDAAIRRGCPTPSPGAQRFGQALATAIVAAR